MPARIAGLAAIAMGASRSTASKVWLRVKVFGPVRTLILSARGGKNCNLLLQEDIWQAALQAEELLLSKAAVLSATVAVDLDATGRSVRTLPVLLDKHLPDQRQLPKFVMDLAAAVEWDDPSRLVATLAKVGKPRLCSLAACANQLGRGSIVTYYACLQAVADLFSGHSYPSIVSSTSAGVSTAANEHGHEVCHCVQ